MTVATASYSDRMPDTVDPHELLTDEQFRILTDWIGAFRVRENHSWPLQETSVFLCDSESGPLFVKAASGDRMTHHITREINGYEHLGDALGDQAPQMLHSDREALLIVVTQLKGTLAQGSEWEFHPGVYRQAGELMARMHAVGDSRSTDSYHESMVDVTERMLDRGGHQLLGADQVRQVRELLHEVSIPEISLVPTHGDFQPRNWLVDPKERTPDGSPRLRLIDFGRFNFRPWVSDLGRFTHLGFIERPELKREVFIGMGKDPQQPLTELERRTQKLDLLVNAVTTVVWAWEMGDEDFHQAGRTMLERVVKNWDEL